MAFQSEREPGVVGMCSNLESMARDGTCNFNPWGSSTPFTEHGLCRQTESHNGGAIAPQRSTERAVIYSAANSTTRGECFQPPLQTTGARQADIGGLRKQLEEEWRTELEKEKRKHDLKIKQLEGEVEEGIRKRKSLEEEVKRGHEYQEQLRKKSKLGV